MTAITPMQICSQAQRMFDIFDIDIPKLVMPGVEAFSLLPLAGTVLMLLWALVNPVESRPVTPVPAASLPAPIARLNLRWTDATGELQELMQTFTPAQKAMAGLAVLATATDVYAARVELSNTGNIPIRVYPGNLRVHYGSDSTTVGTLNDRRFLRPVILQPSETVSGLVTFSARIDVGALIRLGNKGAMSYQDPTITVTYDW